MAESRCRTVGSRRCQAAPACSAPATGSNSAISSPSARCRTRSTSPPASRTAERVELGEVAGQPLAEAGEVAVRPAARRGWRRRPAARTRRRRSPTRRRRPGRARCSASRAPCGWIGAGDGDRLVGAVEQRLVEHRLGRACTSWAATRLLTGATLRRGVPPGDAGRDVGGRRHDGHDRAEVEQVDGQAHGAVGPRRHDVHRDALGRGLAGDADELARARGVEERRRREVDGRTRPAPRPSARRQRPPAAEPSPDPVHPVR